jgi:uncharacterized protein
MVVAATIPKPLRDGGTMRSRWTPRLTHGTLLALWLVGMPAQSQPVPCNPSDARTLAGAYRGSDGSVLSILPADAGGHWRITHFDTGRSHRLHPQGDGSYRSAADLNSEQPVAFRYRFATDAEGRARSLAIDRGGAGTSVAERMALRERPAVFASGEVQLVGRLTLPALGKGPFKAVVFVHGSDPVPSVDREWLPHLLAAHGIATLVFDKRGTGCSQGTYVQHFGVLADDVVAAVRWLGQQPEIDPAQLGLAAFSQGGWVAPLAALKERSIRFVAVGYGLAMSMADEDRLEAPLKLRQAGVDAAGVAEFEALNAALHQVARDEFKDWSRFERLLDEYRARPWLALAARQQSWLAVVMQMGVAQAKVAAPPMFRTFFQPFYDPVPTLEQLRIPMLWLMAGQDIEAPPELTLDVLARLRRQGQPVSVVVFPNADHGMQEFEQRAGERVRTQYAAGYFSTLLQWLQSPK